MALKETATDEAKKLVEYKNYLDSELKALRQKGPVNVKGASAKQSGKGQFENDQDVDQDELNYRRRRIKCLFERAIADNSNCLDDSLWLKYIYFLVRFIFRDCS